MFTFDLGSAKMLYQSVRNDCGSLEDRRFSKSLCLILKSLDGKNVLLPWEPYLVCKKKIQGSGLALFSYSWAVSLYSSHTPVFRGPPNKSNQTGRVATDMPTTPHFRCDDVKKTENTLEIYWGAATAGIEWSALYLGISLDFIMFVM